MPSEKGAASVRLEFRSGERTISLDVARNGERYAVTIDGRPVEVEVLAMRPGEIDLRLGGQRFQAFVAASQEQRQVFLAGCVYTFRLPSETDEAVEHDQTGGPNIVSQMPGTIVKILVKPGQAVEVGGGLLIIESMKMESEITAPLAGTVTNVHIQDGQTVGLGEPLLDIEPAPAADQPKTA
jgi:biotin carboxyl carrier protein